MKNSGKAVGIGRRPCGQAKAADRIRRNTAWIKAAAARTDALPTCFKKLRTGERPAAALLWSDIICSLVPLFLAQALAQTV